MSAVEVPAELLEHVTARLEYESQRLHNAGSMAGTAHSRDVWEVCDGLPCREDREKLTALRALLPQPEATCPNCGHGDDLHARPGCEARMDIDSHRVTCDCPISGHSLDAVRTLVTAERDSKPAGAPAGCRCGHPREVHYGEAGYPHRVAGWHCAVVVSGLNAQCACVGYRPVSDVL